jgi:sialidase-1
MRHAILTLALPFMVMAISLPAIAEEALTLDSQLRERCLRVLRAGMHSDEFWPSIHAAEGLTSSGHGDEVLAFLKPKLTVEADDQRRCGLAREMARAGDMEQSKVMMEILRSENPHGHVHAAESLYKVGWNGDSTPLHRAFAQTDDTRLRLMAAAALAKHQQDAIRAEAFALLRSTLANEGDSETFRIAAWVLARIGSEQDLPLLRHRIADAEDSLTLAFLQHALAALGDPAGKQDLLANLGSADATIRTYAAVFAGEANIKEAVAALIGQLDDDNLDARVRAAQALIVLSR